jgi:salicylate hydroxylase
MDLLNEGFRPKYEAVCVGNKNPKDEHVFFEGLLCKEGLGKAQEKPCCRRMY